MKNERNGLYMGQFKTVSRYISGETCETPEEALHSLKQVYDEWRFNNKRKKATSFMIKSGVSEYDIESDGKTVTMLSIPYGSMGIVAPKIEGLTSDLIAKLKERVASK